MFPSDDALAIPLWINGHAFLTMAPAFLDVRDPASGKVLRRTPLCGAGEASKAVEAANSALFRWATLPVATRAALLGALGVALAGYATHFAGLIVEESGKDAALAELEVAEAVSLFAEAGKGDGHGSGVLGIVGDGKMPLLGALRHAVPAWLGGAVVVIKPNPETPSALFALAELAGRCGFPGGVYNILHGGNAAVDGLRAAGGVSLLYS